MWYAYLLCTFSVSDCLLVPCDVCYPHALAVVWLCEVPHVALFSSPSQGSFNPSAFWNPLRPCEQSAQLSVQLKPVLQQLAPLPLAVKRAFITAWQFAVAVLYAIDSNFIFFLLLQSLGTRSERKLVNLVWCSFSFVLPPGRINFSRVHLMFLVFF